VFVTTHGFCCLLCQETSTACADLCVLGAQITSQAVGAQGGHSVTRKSCRDFTGFWRISVCYLKSLKSLSKPQPSHFSPCFLRVFLWFIPGCETSKGFQPLPQVATAPPPGTWRRSGRASRTRSWRLKGSSRQRRPGNCWPPGAETAKLPWIFGGLKAYRFSWIFTWDKPPETL